MAQQIDNDERGLGREADRKEVVPGTDISLEGGACGVGLLASIGQQFHC